MQEPGRTREPLPTRILGYLCGASVATMAILMSIQVIGRYLLHSPPDWTEELARVVFVYATFFGGALAVARRAHLGIDLLPNALPVRWRAAVQILWRLIACVVLLTVAYQGYFVVQRLSVQPLTSVPISKGFMFAAVPLGCAVMFVYEALRIAYETKVFTTGDDPIHDRGMIPAEFVARHPEA